MQTVRFILCDGTTAIELNPITWHQERKKL
jgi:hypothetical protein